MSFLTTLSVARPALAAFAAMGVGWGSYAAALPDLKTMLDIDETQLGLVIFLTPIAAVGAMLVAPAVGAALGRVALPVASVCMALAFALPGQAASVWLFPIAMLFCGAATGLTDVLMNARVTTLEGAKGLHLMTLSHALYSFGYAGGALLTGLLRTQGWSPGWVLGSMAAIAALLALCSYEADGTIQGLRKPKGKGAGRLGMIPVIGGAIVLVSFLSENAAENWSALHIEQTLGGSPADGAMAPAALALTMGVARLVAQGFAQRIGPAWVLGAGAVVAAGGAVVAAFAGSPAVAYLGFTVMGIGSALIAPTAFSLVGQMAAPEARARAVARATLLGYFGYFFGPPLLGLIAGSFGLPAAFVFTAAILLAVPALALLMLRERV